MAAIVVLVVIVTALTSALGFGGDDNSIHVAAPNEIDLSLTPAVGSVAEAEGITLRVNGIVDPFVPDEPAAGSPDEPRLSSAPGRHFVAVDLTVENAGARELYYPCLYATLVDSEGFAYGSHYSGKKPQLSDGRLESGQRSRGWVTFEFADGAKAVELSCQATFIEI